ncbi:MAG: sulfurtransferase TusA family protein [Candidatus Obscuribacterales bacterium]|jgi:sulfite reductase (ferredoxin)|nr:sulfurtransferase TusA family protein [Candidatus Obscuribacterales bacterium]
MTDHHLDLRGVACPMNYVKTKLFLDKLPTATTIEVMLDQGEPVESVTSSLAAEGHQIVENKQQPEGYFIVTIRKV